jgi:hypothetical protein
MINPRGSAPEPPLKVLFEKSILRNTQKLQQKYIYGLPAPGYAMPG